jgi:hypothetical protein
MPILTSIIDFSFPNLKLDMVRRLIVMVESRRIPTYPLPPWETNLSNKFQMLDGESFWLTIAKTFPSLKDLNFILNKVKVANLRQISFVEPTGPPYHRPVLPTLRVALQELIDSVIDGFVRRVSEFEEGASDSYWFDMTFDCLMFVEEKPSWYKGRPIPDYTSWL